MGTSKREEGNRAGRPAEKVVRHQEQQELEAGAGEAAQCLKALDSLADQFSTGYDALFWPPQTLHTYTVHTQIYRQVLMHIQSKSKNRFLKK